MRYDLLTRILHFALALGISTQMLTSLVMVDPRPGRLPNAWFEVHETLGVALLAVLVAHWLWSVARTLATGQPMMLFPWLSAARRRDLAADIRSTAQSIARLRLPEDEGPRPLPAAIQGGGLLIGLFLAATGTAMAVGMAPDGAMGGLLHTVKESHEAVASLMWIYLAVHPSLGLLHRLAGHHIFDRIFGFGR